jgi:hypothetical protein
MRYVHNKVNLVHLIKWPFAVEWCWKRKAGPMENKRQPLGYAFVGTAASGMPFMGEQRPATAGLEITRKAGICEK